MTKYTPTVHHVYNELDRHGIFLGLERLSREKNAEYKQRLLDVFVNRANSTYRGLINGITRELGLSIEEYMIIRPNVDVNGNLLYSQPAIVFQDTKVYVYTDYTEGTLADTLDRFDSDSNSFLISGLIEDIEATGVFSIELLPIADTTKRSMTIFNQSSIGISEVEDISGKGSRIVLKNQNLIEGTIIVRSPNLLRLRSSITGLINEGDYYIDIVSGTLYTRDNPAPGSFIIYGFRDDELRIQVSPVVIHNLQSDVFKEKMFEQELDPTTQEYNDSIPTILGADIVNELLSVFPTTNGL